MQWFGVRGFLTKYDWLKIVDCHYWILQITKVKSKVAIFFFFFKRKEEKIFLVGEAVLLAVDPQDLRVWTNEREEEEEEE